jgi:uncharacterized protein DUF6144
MNSIKSKEDRFLENIPSTGRIGRFAKIVNKEAGKDVFLKVMKGSNKYKSLKVSEKSLWWKNSTERLEKEIGREDAIKIMKCCGEKCCGKGLRKTAKRLMEQAKTIKGFLKLLEIYEVKEGDLKYELKDDHTIIARHNKCFCKQVASVKDQFENITYCQCSAEFNKRFFEAALERPVEVSITQSIISGGKYCKFIIKY